MKSIEIGGGRGFGLFLAALVLLSAGVGSVAAMTVDDPTGLNYGADATPNPKIVTDVTKDVHKVGEWKPTEYEGDNGKVKQLDAHVNASKANPVTLVATNINETDFTQFPRNGESSNSASWIDASEWSTSGSNISVSETTTAPNVEALTISTSGLASGYTDSATYSNFSIDSDEAKRHIQLAADVSKLESGAHVEIQVHDADNDYKNITVDPDSKASADDVLANSTGEGFVLQQQLGKLTTRSDGDGDGFDNIESVKVTVTDADASVTFSLVNSEKMGQYAFGDQAYDGSDDNSEKDETRTLYEPTGTYSVKAIDTLGDTFSDATVRNVQISMVFAASDLKESMDAQANFTKATNYPSFEWMGTFDYRLQLPSAYDLSYSNAKLVMTAGLPEDRYQVVQIAEGVSDTPFEDISSWTDVTSKVDQGKQVVLDSTIQPGQQIAFESQELLTKNDKSNALATDGGVVGTTGGDSGGIVSFFLSIPGMIVSAIGGLLGIKMVKG